jgi:hypothetical protein
MQRAGVVVALAGSALLALPATSALAVAPAISVSPNSATVRAGSDTTVTVQITARDVGDTSVKIGLTGLPDGVTCASGCGTDVPIKFGDPAKNQLLTLKATSTAPAANQTQVTVQAVADGGSDTANFSLTVNAAAVATTPPQVATVKEVSGRVTDLTGTPVPGASVALLDSQNHSYSTTTNSSGTFKFLGTTQNPITPGQIELGAMLNDKTQKKTVNGSANQSLTNQRIALAVGDATPSATAQALPTDNAVPTDEATTDTAGSNAPQQAASNQSSGGLGSWMLIIIGGLLVALGVGAIVLLWMRRKENDDEDEDAPNGVRAAGGPGHYGGGADPTRVANRAGMGADATSINRSLADAPTMMHNRPLVDDEFPDPYGAPLPSQQPPTSAYGAAGQPGYGYGGAPGQGEYGAGPAGGYGNAPGGGYGDAPGSGAGAGYGNAPGSGAGAGYGAPANGYGGPANGYAPGAGPEYGNAPGSGAGYGNAPGAGGYGNAPGSGAGGYGAGEQPGAGYPPAPAGYPPAAPNGRYDEPTGRYDGPSAGGSEYAPPADPYAQGSSYGADASDGTRAYGAADQQPYGGQGQGYGQGGGYGTPPAGAGYDQQGEGYGAGARGYGEQPGYGSGPAAGYEQPQAGGYDQRGGYDRGPEQQHGGYDNRGGYDQQQGGYYDEAAQGGPGRGGAAAPQQPNRGGERRSLDWLDD